MICKNCGGKMRQLLFSYVCADSCDLKKESSNDAYPVIGYVLLTDDDVDRMKGNGKSGTGAHSRMRKTQDDDDWLIHGKVYRVKAEFWPEAGRYVNLFACEEDVAKADISMTYQKKQGGAANGIVLFPHVKEF